MAIDPRTQAPTTGIAGQPAPKPATTPQEATSAGMSWVPTDHPLYGTPGYVGSTATPPPPPAAPAAPTTTAAPVAPAAPAPAPTATTAMTPQQAMAAGLEWVPPDHPAYGTPGYVGSTPGGTAATGQPGAAPGTDVPAPANQALQTPGTVGNQAAQGTPTTVAQAFQQALINQLAPAPATTENPEIQGQLAAQRGVEQRSRERDRAQLAELAGSRGLDQNAFGSQLRGINAESAQREGAYAGDTVGQLGRELRGTQAAQTGLAGNMLQYQDSAALQRELANLQAELTRQGYTTQQGIASADTALRDKLGTGQLNLNTLIALLNNQQFGQGLGAQIGMFEAGQNAGTVGSWY